MTDHPTFRRATEDDLPAIVALLTDDELGQHREQSNDLTPYLQAFAAIDADPNQLLLVADDGGEVVGTVQLTFVPGLSRGGATRCQLEAVRVAAPRRGDGLGRRLLGFAIDEARRRGCALVQLTSDKRRTEAIRFYESLGFTATHEGLKLPL